MTSFIIEKIENELAENSEFKDIFWKSDSRFCGSNKYGFHLYDPETGKIVRIGSKNEFNQYGREANQFRQQMLDGNDDSREAYRKAAEPFEKILNNFGTVSRIAGLDHKLKYSLEDMSEEAATERKAVAKRLSAFADELKPYWPALFKVAEYGNKVTSLRLSVDHVTLHETYGKDIQDFAFSAEGMAELVAKAEMLNSGNVSSKETFEAAIALFDFARQPEQSSDKYGATYLRHLPWKVAPSLAGHDGVKSTDERKDAECKLRSFYALNIAPFLSVLKEAFEISQQRDIQFGLQLQEDGVYITKVVSANSPKLVKHNVKASFAFTQEGLDALLRHLRVLPSIIRSDARHTETNESLRSFVLGKYNTQRSRLSLTTATVSVTEHGVDMQRDGLTLPLTMKVVKDLMAELREFRKNNPGLENRLNDLRKQTKG